MCGLTGLIARPGASGQPLEAIVGAMTATLSHRGPDMTGVWSDEPARVALGHRRLSILDLSEDGRQPMVSQSGRYVIVYNGEIYNFAEIRDRLTAAGHTVRGSSDTAALLAAIDAWGLERTLAQLSGMFALAVWDSAERSLSLARDRAGKKPLYYGLAAGNLVFASELKAICAFPGFERQVDRRALTSYFRDGFVPAPLSIWQGIAQLPPGCVVTIDAAAATLSTPPPRAYWSWTDMARDRTSDAFTGSDEEAVDRLEETLRQAVRTRMVADVPVGAFLSGGVDSSIIAALMQQESGQPIRTFTIGFQEDDFNEAAEARRVAGQIGSRHCDLLLSPAVARDVIPDLATIYDEPFADPSAIPMVHVARLARGEVTVCLSGDGGDELFGGYARYALASRLARRLDSIPRWARSGLGKGIRGTPLGVWDMLVRRMPRGAMPLLRGPLSGDRMHKLAALLDAEDHAGLYRRMTSVCERPALLVRGGSEPVSPFPPPDLGSPLRHMMLRDSLNYLPDDILVKVDRATMSVGLEARAPMLDSRMIDLAWSLPAPMLTRDGAGKWPLRQLYARLLPGGAQDRPKRGFSVPIADWLRGPLREWAGALLKPDALAAHGLLEPEPIAVMWAEHLSGKRQWGAQLWSVLMVCAWAERWLASTATPADARSSSPMEIAA